MGALKKFITWFRDSVPPPSHDRAVRTIRGASSKAEKASRAILRAPHSHYYAFYYPKGREPGSGWKHPKAYVGPFATKTAAEEGLKKSWASRAGEPRARFKIKRLTAAQFKKIWGSISSWTLPLGEQG